MNLIDCFTDSQRRAHEVLKRVRVDQMPKVAYEHLSVTGWRYGREHGYLIFLWTPTGERAWAIGEDGGSDRLVVYEGYEKDFDYTTGSPKGLKPTYFSCVEYLSEAEKTAAAYISAAIERHLSKEAA